MRGALFFGLKQILRIDLLEAQKHKITHNISSKCVIIQLLI